MYRIDHHALEHWVFPTVEEAEDTAASWNLSAGLVRNDAPDKDFAVFIHDGHSVQRVQGFPLYGHEAEATAAAEGYPTYGFWAARICNDHPEHPRESCPEPHDLES